ncbi:hypothetical protein ABEF92_002484 [Exophiala dermatitidis]|uniref:Uncharacterized protein n=1 Tax=Exophiala dermatitidis (strain ATCC 34100 / CBS 525.76 / NIH/UT8656) TaxID=858893 RepID=H6BL21_EXODN|nr:uncharacterized protein HMPREF1120_00978 [Exophiala dermatitidis NIH/UT8656]EHY52769.1 hypothetical protein HMPREF1120_00978 [Exophiala dermatitidis NIH/UT8656]
MSLIQETENDVKVWGASHFRRREISDWASNGMKEIIDQVILPENREWYYKVMNERSKRAQQAAASRNININASDKFKPKDTVTGSVPVTRTESTKSRHISSRNFNGGSKHSRASSLEEYLNKPLPPLPPPEFKYMFADADRKDSEPQVKTEQAAARNSSRIASDSSVSSIGLDSSELSQFAFATAGVDISTRATSLCSDRASANETRLYEASAILSSPEPEPMQYEFNKTHHGDRVKKVILQPKSQKSKAQLRNDQYYATPVAEKRTITAPAAAVKAPNPEPTLQTVSSVPKRSARTSFLTKSTAIDTNNDGSPDYNVNFLSTKKLCVEHHRHSRDVQSMRASSVYSSNSSASAITKAASESVYSVDSVATADFVPPRPAPTGYPGQFESYESDFLHCRQAGISSPRTTFTFGDPLHPNNQFTHTNFLADPTWPSKNYTKQDLKRFPLRKAALKHADGATIAAVRLLSRTDSEENLRREVQRECAAARLEGVAAGQYRYYQGHMTLEEYMAAKVCVCWDACWCSKLCTIYGDILCPCNEWLVLENRD